MLTFTGRQRTLTFDFDLSINYQAVTAIEVGSGNEYLNIVAYSTVKCYLGTFTPYYNFPRGAGENTYASVGGVFTPAIGGGSIEVEVARLPLLQTEFNITAAAAGKVVINLSEVKEAITTLTYSEVLTPGQESYVEVYAAGVTRRRRLGDGTTQAGVPTYKFTYEPALCAQITFCTLEAYCDATEPENTKGSVDCEAKCKVSVQGPGTGSPHGDVIATPYGRFEVGLARAFAAGVGEINRLQNIDTSFRPAQTMTSTARLWRVDTPETLPVPVEYKRGTLWNGPITTTGSGSDLYQFGGDTLSGIIKSDDTSGVRFSQSYRQVTTWGIPGPDQYNPGTNVYTYESLAPYARFHGVNAVGTLSATTCRAAGQYSGVSLSQAASFEYESNAKGWVIAPTFGPKGWYGTDATITVTQGGALSITATSSTSSAQRFYLDSNPVIRTLGYRYVEIKYRSVGSANTPFLFSVNSSPNANFPIYPYANLTTGAEGEWKTATIDVLADFPNYQPNGLGWNTAGMNFPLESWVIKQLPQGKTLEIESIKGVRKYESLVSTYYVGRQQDYPFLTGHTDGLLSLNLSGSYTIPTAIPQTGIGIDVANQPFGGWIYTPQPALSGAILTPDGGTVYPASQISSSSAYRQWLGGGGLFYEGGNSLDVPADSGANIPNQVMGYGLGLYDGCGNAQEGGSHSTALQGRFDIILGTQVVGVVVPASGSVVATQDGTQVASATPRESGWYRMRTPGLFSLPNIPNSTPIIYNVKTTAAFRHARRVTESGTTTFPGGVYILKYNGAADGLVPRRMEYVRWYVTPEQLEKWLSTDTSPSGLTLYADATDNTLHISQTTNWATTEWQTWDTGIAAARPCLRFAPGNFDLWVTYEAAGAIARRRSYDGGRTWVMAVTIAADGKYPCMAHAPTGWILHGWRDTTGAAQVKAVDAFGNTLFGPIAAVASGVAEDALALTWDSSASRFYLLYRETGGAVKTKASADGRVWA